MNPIIRKKNNILTKEANVRRRQRKYTRTLLLAYLKELSVKLNHTPSCSEIDEERLYSHTAYITSFGSIKNAQLAAGLSPNKKFNSIDNARRGKNYISKAMCLEDIMRLRKLLGRSPSLSQLKTLGKYPYSKYYNRLGGIKIIRNLADNYNGDIEMPVK